MCGRVFVVELLHSLRKFVCMSRVINLPDYYNNKEVRELLGVDDKIIRKYRDRGLLGYTVVGDKFWYSQGDIKDFLNRNRHEAFAK